MTSNRRKGGLCVLTILGGLAWNTQGFTQAMDDVVPTGGPQVLHMPESKRLAEQGILRPVPVVADLPMDISVRTRRVQNALFSQALRFGHV